MPTDIVRSGQANTELINRLARTAIYDDGYATELTANLVKLVMAPSAA